MTVRLGILSAAHVHADHYADAIASIDGVELVGVADDDHERGKNFAASHGIEYAATEDVLADINGAIVTAPNTEHGVWVDAAAAAGVPVLCEKPLATTREEAARIATVADEAGIALGVAMPVRFNPPIQRAKAAYEAGKLGEVHAIVGTNILQRIAAGTWMTDPELAGGGAIMDHTVHVVDLARWITGEEVIDVYAETGTRFESLDVEDIDVLSMELADGTIFSHDGSWRQPPTWDFWGDVTMRLIGDAQVMEVDCFDQTVTLTTDDDGREQLYWGSDMNVGLIRDFTRSITDGTDPAIPAREGVPAVAVVEAAYESAASGEPIRITYD